MVTVFSKAPLLGDAEGEQQLRSCKHFIISKHINHNTLHAPLNQEWEHQSGAHMRRTDSNSCMPSFRTACWCLVQSIVFMFGLAAKRVLLVLAMRSCWHAAAYSCNLACLCCRFGGCRCCWGCVQAPQAQPCGYGRGQGAVKQGAQEAAGSAAACKAQVCGSLWDQIHVGCSAESSDQVSNTLWF
jgi:hypothetical protein